MGMIDINLSGSFKPRSARVFYAQTSGHTMAVHDAIKWLAEYVLPAAEKHDRALRAEGVAPDDNFQAFDAHYERENEAVAEASRIMDKKIADAGGLIPLLEKRQSERMNPNDEDKDTD